MSSTSSRACSRAEGYRWLGRAWPHREWGLECKCGEICYDRRSIRSGTVGAVVMIARGWAYIILTRSCLCIIAYYVEIGCEGVTLRRLWYDNSPSFSP